jgi:anti-sigma regulatory factor (Ser/Thr protein kinase)
MSAVRERVVDLPANAAAAGMARRELASTPGIGGELGYKALLMASELIAVYVQDVEPGGGATVRLSIVVGPQRVRIEVGGGAPAESTDALLKSRETPSLGGMGLQIVDRLADAWGVYEADESTIWFELARA